MRISKCLSKSTAKKVEEKDMKRATLKPQLNESQLESGERTVLEITNPGEIYALAIRNIGGTGTLHIEIDDANFYMEGISGERKFLGSLISDIETGIGMQLVEDPATLLNLQFEKLCRIGIAGDGDEGQTDIWVIYGIEE